jgi:outer membrane biosynthesis protein TonB
MGELLADLAAAQQRVAELEKVKLGLLGELKAKGIEPKKVTPPAAPAPAPAPAPAFQRKPPSPKKETRLDAVPVKKNKPDSPKKVATNHHRHDKKAASPKKATPPKKAASPKKAAPPKKAASPKKAAKAASPQKPKKKTKSDLIREVTKMCKDLDYGDVKRIHDFVTEVWEDDGN